MAPIFNLLPRKIAVDKVINILQHLKNLPHHHGLFPQWIDAPTGRIATHWPGSNEPIPTEFSTVDNGHLAVGLAILPHLLPETGELANELFNRISFTKLYNKKLGVLKGMANHNDSNTGAWDYQALYTETLNASLIGIKGGLPVDHLYHLALWQYYLQKLRQGEVGSTMHSWGGAMFEGLLSRLFFDSPLLNHPVWEKSDRDLVEAQIDWAGLHNDGIFGQSPSGTYIKQDDSSVFGYKEFGHNNKALWDKGYEPTLDPYISSGIEVSPVHVTTPHAFLLALKIAPNAVIDLIYHLTEKYPQSYTRHGFRESVNSSGDWYPGFFSLTQAISFLAIATHLRPGILSKPTTYECSPLRQTLNNYNPLDAQTTVSKLKQHIPPIEWSLLDDWLQKALTPNMACPPPELHSLN